MLKAQNGLLFPDVPLRNHSLTLMLIVMLSV